VRAVVGELHLAGHLGEDRVVLADAHVQSRAEPRPRWRTMIEPPGTRLPS
jgi:hypothetical protein